MRSCAACSTVSSIGAIPISPIKDFLDACGLTEEELDLGQDISV